ncbi:MAG: hypothetical protein LBQ90_02005 [Synergistaceae bacterium]|nr:hypothetical protein [Synergistaceae bacterium]
MVVFIAIVVLGFLRFHASRLEYLLNTVYRNIERYSTEEMELKQAYSGLSSPTRIYSYCRDVLGMDRARNVEMIQVNPVHLASAPEVESKKSWRSSLFSFFGLTIN